MLTLPILMYHKVEPLPAVPGYLANYVFPDQFEEQIAALDSWGFTTITLAEWAEIRAGRRKSPGRPIALTFDDGYKSVYENAWPLLRARKMNATVFLVTDFIGQMNFWDRDQPQQLLLNRDEIAEMSASGISFGSHTCTHRPLTGLSEAEVLDELARSREALESLLGQPVTTLAYPYNKQNGMVRAAAKRAGYRAATLGRGRLNARWTNPYALMRIAVTSESTLEGLHLRMESSNWMTGW